MLVGEGTYRSIPAEARRLGARVLVVSDANCARIPEVAETIEALGGRAFTGVPGEPTTTDVETGLAALEGADVIVGIGGGAVLDAAKCIATMARHSGKLVDYVGYDKFTADRLPLVLAPTTAGTGSEVTRFVAITEPSTNVKMLIAGNQLLANVAVVDPLLSRGAPPSVMSSSGVDALTHAIEAYVSRRANATTDIFALGAARALYPALRRAFRDPSDLSARTDLAVGAMHAGVAFGNASVALVHGMSRPIGAYFHVPHGLANAMLLPEVTRWSLSGAPERYAVIAGELGTDDLPGLLGDLAEELKIPPLRTVVDPAKLRELAPTMARDAIASGSPGNNPRVPSEAEIVELYELAITRN